MGGLAWRRISHRLGAGWAQRKTPPLVGDGVAQRASCGMCYGSIGRRWVDVGALAAGEVAGCSARSPQRWQSVRRWAAKNFTVSPRMIAQLSTWRGEQLEAGPSTQPIWHRLSVRAAGRAEKSGMRKSLTASHNTPTTYFARNGRAVLGNTSPRPLGISLPQSPP